jgi:hypothetical protein
VNTTQPLQLFVVERLDAEADAIDAARAKRGESFWRGGLWIGLERDLASAVRSNESRQAAISRAISGGSRSDGVPPPKKIVSAGLPRLRLAVAAWRISRSSAPTYRDFKSGIKQTAIEIAVTANRGTKGI